MQIINQRTELVPIDSVRPHEDNPNQGDIGAISESIDASGFFGHVLVQSNTGRILAGSHRHAAAKALGASEIPVTFVDVDDERARRIMLADNRTARLGADNPEKLAALLQELASTPEALAGTGYDGDALDELLADLGQMPQVQGDPDAVPAVPEDAEPVTKRGDIIRLGRHTLGCIDSTSLDEVRRLLGGVTPDMVWTDPPYGIGVADDGRIGITNLAPRGAYRPMLGDDSTATAVAAYRVTEQLGLHVAVWWGANHYASALPDSAGWIVWDKQNDGNPFADGELAWTNEAGPLRLFRHQWQGMMRASERGEKRINPAQKPVAVAEWCYRQYGKEGDVVLDLFGGSGTALIAAERTGRTCYMAEMSERYCDLIIARWEAATGQQAERPPHEHERDLSRA
jgi:16S rRNA G966 N2-methylase RsmD